MKRIALLTVLLLVVGLSLGFGQEFKPSVAWTTAGTAALTFGVNLDTMETGFTNAGSAQFAVTFVPAATLVKGADAPIYGQITLTTTAMSLFDTSLNNASAATTVAAKIVATPFEIGINAAPSAALGKPTVIENSANYADIVGVLHTADAALATAYSGNGTWIGYNSTPVTVKASIVSIGDWTRAKDTEINYAAGLDATLVFKPITITLGAWQGLMTGKTPIAYVTVATDAIGPLTLGVQADLDLAATLAFDAGATIGLAFTPKTSLNALINYGDTFGGLDARVVFSTTEVANLTETLTAYALDIANKVAATPVRVVVDNTLSYAVKMSDTQTITPSLQVQYGMASATVSVLKAVASVTAAVIPNTSIALTYTSGDFMAATPLLGNVTCAATVSY